MAPDEIPAGVVAAALRADHEEGVRDGRSYHQVAEHQVRRIIAGAVAAERERAALLLDRKRAVFCRPCDGEVCDYSDELAPASELIRESLPDLERVEPGP